MDEVKITKEDHDKGYKLCTTCEQKVHVLKEGCEIPHELCQRCGYSVVDHRSYMGEHHPDVVEGYYGC